MLGHTGNWNKECKPREQRLVCHDSFWCGEDRAHGINLSPGGMCFRIDRRVEPGEVVTLHQGPTVTVKARIAWARRLDKCTEVGVQFLDESSKVSQWVKQFKDDKPADKSGEPILALPAPGQTFHPVINQFKPAGNTGGLNGRGSGKSWLAARKLMG